jgi:hypothetical protein
MCLLLVSVRWQFSCYDLERRGHSSAHPTRIARRAAAMDTGRGYGMCSSSMLRRCGRASADILVGWASCGRSELQRGLATGDRSPCSVIRAIVLHARRSERQLGPEPACGHLNRWAGTGPGVLQRSSIFGSCVSLRRPSRQRLHIRLGDPSQSRIPGGIVVIADLSPRARTGHTSFEGGA